MTLRRSINHFRVRRLGLFPLPCHPACVTPADVPFVKMWSPHLVPKPKDWPAHVDIVGTFNEPPLLNDAEVNQAGNASSDLLEFLSRHDGIRPGSVQPLFIGFGSMVLQQPERIVRVLVEAAAVLSLPVLFQCGWTDLGREQFLEICQHAEAAARLIKDAGHFNARSLIFPSESSSSASMSPTTPRSPKVGGGHEDSGRPCESSKSSGTPRHWSAAHDCLMIGPCDHNWLFNHVSAVVHHGMSYQSKLDSSLYVFLL